MRRTQFEDEFSMMNHSIPRPQGHSYTFQSSTVTYGGSNGAYYSSSTTKRSGSDGVSNVKTFHESFLLYLPWFLTVSCVGFQLRFEEYKEADSVTGQAAHRLSRGIHDKVYCNVFAINCSCFLTLWTLWLYTCTTIWPPGYRWQFLTHIFINGLICVVTCMKQSKWFFC